AARVEGATAGGQIFITASTWEAARPLVEVAPPVELEMKGLAEPLALYEVRGLRGGEPVARPEAAEAPTPLAAPVPLTLSRLDGKVVRPEPVTGAVVRLGRHGLVARLEAAPRPLTTLRLRLAVPGATPVPDVYGKVVGHETDGASALTTIRFTSTPDEAARAI